MHEQHGKFNKELEIMKENQTEILELKSTMNEMENAIETIHNTMDQAKGRIRESEDRTFEIFQSEGKKKKRMEKSKKAYVIYWCFDH